MMREVDPRQTLRAQAFALWMKAPMPMVTLFKTWDVAPLCRLHKRKGYPFHMLLCWCIGKAASTFPEFFLLPVGDKLMEFDRLALNTVVNVKTGGIATCDIPFSPDLDRFSQDYQTLTGKVQEKGENFDLEGYMVIGTSALAGYEIDGGVNLYAGCYNNPFFLWGKYRKKWRKCLLPVSFQFHHTQMDGVPAAAFLQRVQEEIRRLR